MSKGRKVGTIAMTKTKGPHHDKLIRRKWQGTSLPPFLMSLLVSPHIIVPRKPLSTFRASKWLFPPMTPEMTLQIKIPRKALVADGTRPRRVLHLPPIQRRERVTQITLIWVKRPHVLLKRVVRRKSKPIRVAVLHRTMKRSLVAVDMVVAYFCILESFVEVETEQLRAPIRAVPIIHGYVDAGVFRAQIFEEPAVTRQCFTERYDADVIARGEVFSLLGADVVPDPEQTLVKRVSLKELAVPTRLFQNVVCRKACWIEPDEVFDYSSNFFMLRSRVEDLWIWFSNE